MPPKVAPISHVVIAYNKPFKVELQPNGMLRQNPSILDPNGIFANTTKMPFMLGGAYIEQSEMAWQGLKEMVSATQVKPATAGLFRQVVEAREVDRGGATEIFGTPNPELNPTQVNYNEGLALELMTQIQHIKFSQYEGLLQEIIVMLEQVKEEGQSLSDAFEKKFTFVEDCPRGLNPAECRDPRWGALFDPQTRGIEGRNLQGQAVKEGIRRVLLDYEGAGRERVKKKDFYTYQNCVISQEVADQLNATTAPTIPKKEDDASIDPNRQFGIGPTACYNELNQLVYHNEVNSNPTKNIERFTGKTTLSLTLSVVPTPLAAIVPKAPLSLTVNSNAADLAAYIIAQQKTIHDSLFTPAKAGEGLTSVQKAEIRTHATGRGIDWEVFPSSSVANPEKSVMAGVDQKWVRTEQMGTLNAAKTLAKGAAVYDILAKNPEYCKNYVDCVRKYIASHGPTDTVYSARFDKVVESLIGLTGNNIRLLAGINSATQDALFQELREFQIDRGQHKDITASSDPANDMYHDQFFRALAIKHLTIQKQNGRINYAVGLTIPDLIDVCSARLLAIHARLPDKYTRAAAPNVNHNIVGFAKKKWLAQQVAPAHLKKLKNDFKNDSIGIFKKADYAYDSNAILLNHPIRKPTVSSKADWIKWGSEDTSQMVFQVNFASGDYGGATFAKNNGLVQEETHNYLSTTAALITANKDALRMQVRSDDGNGKGNRPTPVAIVGQIGDFEADPATMPTGRPRGAATPEWIAIANGTVKPESIITKRAKFVKFNELAIAADRIEPVKVAGGQEKPKGNDTKESVQALFNNSLAGFQLAKQLATNHGVQCKIETGLFGAGAFNNTAEISIAMQYLAARIAGINNIEFLGIDKEFQTQVAKITAAVDMMIENGLSANEVMNSVLKWQEFEGVAERDVWRKDVPAIQAKARPVVLTPLAAKPTGVPAVNPALAAETAKKEAEKARIARDEAAAKALLEKCARDTAAAAAKAAADKDTTSKLKKSLTTTPADAAAQKKQTDQVSAALLAIADQATKDSVIDYGGGLKQQNIQPFALSKNGILKQALKADGVEIPQKELSNKETKTAEQVAADALEAKKMVVITADMMTFSSETTTNNLTEEEQRLGYEDTTTTKEVTTTSMKVINADGTETTKDLPPPGLRNATFSGLKLEGKVFGKDADISGMNFSNCDLTTCDFTGISEEVFNTLRFSKCVGVGTMKIKDVWKIDTHALVSKDNGNFVICEMTEEQAMDRMVEPQYMTKDDKGIRQNLIALQPLVGKDERGKGTSIGVTMAMQRTEAPTVRATRLMGDEQFQAIQKARGVN